MELSERNLLLDHTSTKNSNNKLSVIFAIVCIVDVFGVFPVITLPKAIIDSGFYGGIIICIVCSIQIYTAILLGKSWIIAEKIDMSVKTKNRYPYSALAEITYGTTFSNFVSFLVNVTIFGGGIPNLIVASQNIELLGLRLSSGTFDVSFCYWIIIIGMILCPVLWLGSPKDMKLLCTISVANVVIVFLLVTGCLLFSTRASSNSSDNTFQPEQSFWELIFICYGIISFQFDIHPSILTIQVDMKEKSKLNSAVLGGFTISLGMFFVVTAIAASKYGLSVKPSLLETLPTTIPLHFAALFVALQLCLSSAVSNSALYQYMEDCMSIPRAFNHRRCVLRTTLTFLAVLIAESVPRFDLVMSLIGGTLTGPLIFIFPPLFYLRMLSMEDKHMKQVAMETFTSIVYNTEEEINTILTSRDLSQFESRSVLGAKLDVYCCVTIIAFSTICTLVTTYVNIKNAIAFANFSQPCIFNVSSALISL
ncbi:amino acid transporter AVT1D [Tribolium madens]|uniref:amino acid transporter AVT1D n=1 Tax=Tribolium madens TaxID=41895 RepID=UPI001CF758FB|nr:amino acid transporter AVT1D [Tribolium madens]